MLTGKSRYETLVIVVTLISMSLVSSAVAQELPARPQMTETGWKVNVVSAIFPEKLKRKLRARIEGDTLVCHSAGPDVLEIPLRAITGITRDTAKDYPAAEFLMGVATTPSSERHTFGSKEYRQEVAARAFLAAFSFVGLLFPKHKEVVLVSWKDDFGEHDAEFRLGRADGQKMLHTLQLQTGLQPRDLEKERKDIEAGKKELRRWVQQKNQSRKTINQINKTWGADFAQNQADSTLPKQANSGTDPEMLRAEEARFLCGAASAESNTKKRTVLISVCRNSLRSLPSHAPAWASLGMAHSRAGESEMAIEAYQEAVALKPDYPEAWHNLGTVYDETKRYDKAIQCFEQAIHYKPDYDLPWYGMGLSLDNSGRYEEALKAYQEAIRLNPTAHKAWNNMGTSYSHLQRYDQAVKAYREAVRVKPDYVRAWNGLISTYDKLGLKEEKIKACQEFTHVAPRNADAWYFLGVALQENNQLDGAITAFEEVTRLAPKDADAWLKLGLAYSSKGDQKKAKDIYKKLQKLDPAKADALSLSMHL